MIILIIHIIVSYDQNISLIFYVKNRSHFRLWDPSCVYFTAHRQCAAVQKIRTPLRSLRYNSLHLSIYLSIYLNLHYIYLSIYPTIYLNLDCIHLFIYLSIWTLIIIFLFIHLSIYLSIYLSLNLDSSCPNLHNSGPMKSAASWWNTVS